MAKRNQFVLSTSERRARKFSENFKKEKVREIEQGVTKVSEISKREEVTTRNVDRWMAKFGSMKGKKERLIVENQSDTVQLLDLRKKIAELERLVGQKQILLEFHEKMIDLAEEHYGVAIKKNLLPHRRLLLAKQGKVPLEPEQAVQEYRDQQAILPPKASPDVRKERPGTPAVVFGL